MKVKVSVLINGQIKVMTQDNIKYAIYDDEKIYEKVKNVEVIKIREEHKCSFIQ